ncbi:MAG: hypothetical protein P4M05_28415 [Bradyrhizobium sp.]|nr:hypothetical protein [Bradyrhizobium sp.]
MANFSVNGTAYQSRIMDGETQTLVLKRMLPVFAALMSCRGALKEAGLPAPDDDTSTEMTVADRAANSRDILMPVARELAALSDADVKFIVDACIDVTKRQLGTGVGWADVRQRGLIQDQSDNLFITRLTIAWHVVGENFAEMLKSFGVDVADLVKTAALGHG